MTPEEITKLAEEYVTKVYGGDTDFIDDAENVISWLLRTHCIVEKSKVREAHEVYHRKWLESKDGNKAFQNLIRMETLEQLFDPDTFDETDK